VAETKKKKNTSKGRASRGRSQPVSKTTEITASDQWKTDIVGVLIVVFGVVFLLATILPDTGVVTEAIANGLFIAFGIGAYIMPILLILLGITFFIPARLADEGRTGAGLAVSLLGIISLISLATPEYAYLDSEQVRHYGGYVGGGIAWLFDMLTGPIIASVILGALVLIGVLITGFSLSDFIRYLWAKRQEKKTVKRNTLKELPPQTKRVGKQEGTFLPRRARKDAANEDKEDLDLDFTHVIERNEPQTAVISEEGKRSKRSTDATEVLTTVAKDEPKREPAPTVRIIEDGFTLPDLNFLSRSAETNPRTVAIKDGELQATADTIVDTLGVFDVTARCVGWVPGPTVTLFKLEIAQGTRLNQITKLNDNLALALAAPVIRILAPIPGEKYVGIEVPNTKRSSVTLGDVLPAPDVGGPLLLGIGKDVAGESITGDLAKMPHLLVGGTTGSGKSVALNAMLISILMRATPTEVRLILVDPKRVEMAQYNDVPHLYVPVVTEAKEAASALAWACAEMDRRLKVLQRAKVKDISAYDALLNSKKAPEWAEKMPYLVIVIDELADLMHVAAKEVESSIARLAGLARAAGIHMIVATQRPEANVITGLIKANIANRIAFSVATSMDSRIILDQPGAERLTGLGDMLFSTPAWAKPKRIQGCFVSEEEIDRVTDFLKEQGRPEYHEDILTVEIGSSGLITGEGGREVDPLMWDAAELALTQGFGSTSSIQRRFQVGYARAGRIMDMLQEHGIVGPPDGSKPRELMVDAEMLARVRHTVEHPDEDYEETQEEYEEWETV